MPLAGLSTGHMIGLALVAAVFIAFALAASFLAPRRWPDFPGRHGLSVFIIACFVLFGAMLTAVEVFGVESEAEGAEAAAGHEGANEHTIRVDESEYRISLPSLQTLAEGEYTFAVENKGQVEHDLVVEGPNVAGDTKTELIQPGGSAKLTVSLAAGTYTLYCSVDGHRQQGMTARVTVG